MRIAVDLRILIVGPAWINRGMARFTQQQLGAVLRLDRDNDYLVLIDPVADGSLLAPQIRQAPNAYVRVPPAWTHAPEDGPGTILRRGEEFQQWLSDLDVDLYHAATPFLMREPLYPQFDACPMVATMYDLIPLVYPAHYLPEGFEGPYHRAVDLVKRADRLLAISESAKRDAQLYLGTDPARIDVAYPSADEVFRPWDPAQARALLSTRRRLPERFVLSVSSYHLSKNLDVLLQAYARLPRLVRTRLPLLLVGNFEWEGAHVTLRDRAEELGIADDVVLLGVISDEELSAFYSCATLVVHPSRYEGFGYPVLEAMSCGAPVITTTATSLPEVGGDATVFVDPDDVDGFASALLELQADPGRRAAMRERGLEQATRFTLADLAHKTLQCYERATAATPAPAAANGGRRLRVAMWTPLPPLQSGVADYAAELLKELRHRFDLEVFVDGGYLPDADLLGQLRVYHASAFERRHRQHPFDMTIYQMGKSEVHWYIHQQFRHHPGVVVLHDLAVSPLVFDHCHARDDFGPLLEELAQVEGTAAEREFAAAMRLDAASRDRFAVEFLKRHPMLRGVTAASQAQVVHTEAARRRLIEQCPDADVAVVEMGVATPHLAPGRVQALDARRALGYSPGTFVVSALGIVHQTKRVEQCIRVLPEVLAVAPETLLVIVGRSYDAGYAAGLVEVARQVGVADHVRLRGHLPRREFERELAACDAVVNLRTPSPSHMSATLVRALGAAKPVVISDLPDWASIPDNACLRVPAGPGELTALSRHLTALAGDHDLRARLSAGARAWFLDHGTIASMAAQYGELIHQVWRNGRARGEVRHSPPLLPAAAGARR